MAIKGTMDFPGLLGVRKGTFNYSPHGVQPSRAIIEIVPQRGIPPEDGLLLLTFGNTKHVFPNALIDKADMRRNAGGFIVSVQIMDRRWKWEYGEITGVYNQRNQQNELIPNTEKSPRQLATLLLRAMNEGGFNVSALPNNPNIRPTKHWVNANPARELDQLCSDLGCVVSLELDNRVRLRRQGVGANLPTSLLIRSVNYSFNPGNVPDSIKLVSNKVTYQATWELEAVGIDTDGTIKLIDDLTYKPTSGWEKESPIDPSNVLDQFGETARANALRSVWRWYRITNTLGSRFDKDTFFTRNQVLPIYDVLLQSEPEPTDSNEIRQKPAFVRGEYWKGDGVGGLTFNTDTGDVVDTKFTIDRDRGIVVFDEPVFRTIGSVETSDVEYKQATITLDTTFNAKGDVANPDRRTWNRAEFVKRLRSSRGTGPLVIRDDSVVPWREITTDGVFITDVDSNLREVGRQSRQIVNARADTFRTLNSLNVEYAGLHFIPVDGARNQISWSVGPAGAITVAGFNNEFGLGVASQKVKRRKSGINTGLGGDVKDILSGAVQFTKLISQALFE